MTNIFSIYCRFQGNLLRVKPSASESKLDVVFVSHKTGKNISNKKRILHLKYLINFLVK